MRNNFFRRATENPEALAAYAKFLRGEKLVESAAQGFSSLAFQDKMHRIQAELPGWIQKSGQQAQAMPLIENIKARIKDRKWQEADKVADELLALMSAGAKTDAASSGFTIAAFQDKDAPDSRGTPRLGKFGTTGDGDALDPKTEGIHEEKAIPRSGQSGG